MVRPLLLNATLQRFNFGTFHAHLFIIFLQLIYQILQRLFVHIKAISYPIVLNIFFGLIVYQILAIFLQLIDQLLLVF